MVAVIVNDVAKLFWVVVVIDVDIWDTFRETLVALDVDFKVVEVVFVENPGVAILEVITGLMVTYVTFFEAKETEVGDGFRNWGHD